jgi:hypothetical protein
MTQRSQRISLAFCCLAGFASLALIGLSATAQTSDVPAPPRLQQAPATATSQRPAVPPPAQAPQPSAPAPSLESQLQPDLKPLPKDPTERAIENTRRVLQERNDKQKRSTTNTDAKPDVVTVTGDRPTPAPAVSDKVDRVLNPQTETTVTETLPGGMARRECVADCTGPACCVTIERDPASWKQNPKR